MNVEIGIEGRAIPFLGMHNWDIRCSVLDTKIKVLIVHNIYMHRTHFKNICSH
jgi:hypothetical protein